jgi:hypothetical protein
MKLRLAVLVNALVLAVLLVPGAQSAPAATKAEAISIVKTIVRKNARPCKLAMKSIKAARLPLGWRVTVTVKVRGASGHAAWHVRGLKAYPADPFAKSIGKGCR